MNYKAMYNRPSLLHPLFRLSLIAITLFWASTVFAQGWEYTYPQEGRSNFTQVIQTPDQGYLAIGSTENENTELSEIYLVKTDVDGNLQWSETYGDSNEDVRAGDLIETDDGGWLILGSIGLFDNNTIDNYLLKINPNRSIQWSKRLGYPDRDAPAYIRKAIGGGYIFASRKNNFNDHIFVKVDEQGEVEWDYEIEETGGGITYPPDLEVLDNAYLFTGAEEFVKVDPSGNMLWSVELPLKVNSMIALSDGNFLLSSTTSGGEFISKRTADGVELWNNTVNSTGDTRAVPIVETTDGGFIFVETDNDFIGLGISYQTKIVKANANGNELWKKEIGLINGYNAALIKDHANDLIFAGYRYLGNATSNTDALLLKSNEEGEVYSNHIEGSVFVDDNTNCTFEEAQEAPINGWLIKAVGPQTLYGNSDLEGLYSINADSGTYEVSLIPNNPYWSTCPPQTVQFTSFDSISLTNMAAQVEYECPALTVDFSTPFLRRCFENDYTVQYCNNGTIGAEDARIEIDFDPNLIILSSTLMWSSQMGNLYTFDLGDLEPGDCGTFKVRTLVDCESELGQTHCSTAHIYPDSICLPSSVIWDGSSILVEAECDADSVRFKISNIGAGNMSQSLDYIVVEDEIMFHQESFQLGAGQSFEQAFFATGSTFRMEAQQAPGHPGVNFPAAAIEGCGTAPYSLGLINGFRENDDNYFVSIDCQENIGSFDPNDKRAFPRGIGEEHFIAPYDDLEYHIRFQNTGTDTAFTVVIRDTLSEWLDVATLQMGAASHPYELRVEHQGILKITFSDILLPDSTTNEPASHGFVKFRIQQKEDNTIGTMIYNTAAIYFDFNEPIITNETYHEIGAPLLTSTVDPDAKTTQNIKLKIQPNPFTDHTTFDLAPILPRNNLMIHLYDYLGRNVYSEWVNTDQYFQLERKNLPAGLYYYEFVQNHQAIVSGKLVIE